MVSNGQEVQRPPQANIRAIHVHRHSASRKAICIHGGQTDGTKRVRICGIIRMQMQVAEENLA